MCTKVTKDSITNGFLKDPFDVCLWNPLVMETLVLMDFRALGPSSVLVSVIALVLTDTGQCSGSGSVQYWSV